ncbi:MAG: DUF4070 domain-containing protein [Verrucomicrobiae bacterium]|nr:DUF4070 domain-containing protein [Verrucomicrobiae bacterium]
MNILLLYPKFPDTFWSFNHALKFVRKKAAFPPLGLLTVAAMLPGDWNKRLVDVNVQTLTPADLKWADCALISGMIVQEQSASELIARCHEAGVRVVAGGPLFTNEPALFPTVDHLVLNEAELTLPPFLSDLERGCAKPVYSTTGFADIRQTPVPLWHLADLRRYASICLQYSRGCPFQCEFCNVTALFGHRPRAKSAQQVIAELDGFYAAGWRGSAFGPVFFVDDNFIGNKALLKNELLPALIEWQKGHQATCFQTEVSINLADDEELMRLMVDAGFNSVFIGIETPDDGSLGGCGKKQNLGRNLLRDVRRIQQTGLQVQAGFIVGFDQDTPSIFQRQIDFIQNSGIVTAMVGVLQAPPGTRLHDRMQREGRLVGQTTGDNSDGTTNIIPRMNGESLRQGYHKIMRHLYSPRNYYRRIKTFLRHYRMPKFDPPLGWDQCMAFGRTVFHLGICGQERFQYWGLLAWTLARRPRLLPLAVTLSIYGHHFRKVCAQIQSKSLLAE